MYSRNKIKSALRVREKGVTAGVRAQPRPCTYSAACQHPEPHKCFSLKCSCKCHTKEY